MVAEDVVGGNAVCLGVLHHGHDFVVGRVRIIAAHDDFRRDARLVEGIGHVEAVFQHGRGAAIPVDARTQHHDSVGLKRLRLGLRLAYLLERAARAPAHPCVDGNGDAYHHQDNSQHEAQKGFDAAAQASFVSFRIHGFRS